MNRVKQPNFLFSLCSLLNTSHLKKSVNVQGDSVARGPELLYIKNYVFEVVT